MQRFTWCFATSNILGAVAATALAALVVAFLHTRQRGNTMLCAACAVAATVSLIALAGSQSRGGLVAALTGMLSVILVAREPSTRAQLAGAALLIAVACCAWPGDWQRWRHARDGDPSIGSRVYAWRVAAVTALDHPLRGIGGGTTPLATACMTIAEPPPALRSRIDNPFGWAYNDALDVAAKRGLPLAAVAVAAAALPIAIGVTTARQGFALGAVVLAGGTAWLAAGAFSCVWFFDRWASAVTWATIVLGAAACTWRLAPRSCARCLVAAVSMGALTVVVIVAVGVRSAPNMLVLENDEAGGWRARPRHFSVGTMRFYPDAGNTTGDVARYVLGPAARDGWISEADSSVSSAVVTRRPLVLVAQSQALARAFRDADDSHADALVLLDPSPQALRAATSSQPILVAVGTPNPWAITGAPEGFVEGNPRRAVVVIPAGPLWLNRFPRAWPAIARWMRTSSGLAISNAQ